MTRSKTTKRALLVSAIALVLCCAMLVGTTFAWFTDSVTSGRNIIQSGNLDVELYYSVLDENGNWTNYAKVGALTDVFGYNNWEPGYTAVAKFKVVNEGSLALKYQLTADVYAEEAGTNAAGESFKLSDYLLYGVTASLGDLNDRDTAAAAATETFKTFEIKASALEADAEAEVGMVITMPESVGNVANHNGVDVPSIEFGITLVATQAVSESDSFGSDYDANAQFPVIPLDVTSGDDLAKAVEGQEINLLSDITLSEAVTLPANVTLYGNGNQINGTIYAGGDLTIGDHVKVTGFSASYYDRVITVEEDACLEITGGDRVSVAYGNVFEVKGSIADAQSADKSNVQPSLVFPAGISVTGGSDATFNINDAYVVIGSTSSKNSSANGTFNMNFNNAIVEFTNQFTLSEPTGGKNPTFNVNIVDSVVTIGTKFCIAAPNSNVVIDNSTVTIGTYLRNSGTITLKNGSTMTGSTIQFGENGGNNGIINVDNSTLTVVASSTGHAFDGKGTGKIVLSNNAVASVTYYKAMEILCDASSTFAGSNV